MYMHAKNVAKAEQINDTLEGQKLVLNDSIPKNKSGNSKRKRMQDYTRGNKYLHWAPIHSDTSGYMCELTLHEITALYWFHGQCAYDYFTYIRSDTTMDVLWSYRPDCILGMDFFEKSHGIKKHPKRGDIFASFTLVNDTTLSVKYNFPKWVEKVNEIAKDSLFPNTYYLVQSQ